jgi:hypothetical protein
VFWEDSDISWDWEDPKEQGSDWNEYVVSMYLVDKRETKPITLNIWSTGLDEAMTCGEVLSAIYLNG